MKRRLADWAARYEIIVLEGCDGVGKTTVAAALASAYGYTTVHSGRTPDGMDLAGRYPTPRTLGVSRFLTSCESCVPSVL